MQFRASVFDVVIDGAQLWTATGYGVQLLDRLADPPVPLHSVALPGSTRVVRISGGLAYAASGSRIYILRKNNHRVEVIRGIDVGAGVNDIAFTSSQLYAATSGGIFQFDLIDPANPSRTTVRLSTSNQNVLAIAILGNTMYAADGDATVEMFNIQVPSLAQGSGSLTSLPRSIAVQATGARVYVSDGQNTDVFAGTTRIGRVPFGSTSLAALNADELYVAGTDRAVRAVDFTVAGQPVELFESQLAPTPGTQNRVFAMAVSGSRLYVAAGDIGLASYDTTSFTRPYVIRSHGGGPATSAIASGSTAWITPSAGGIAELTISSNNIATQTRVWNSTSPSFLHDLDGDRLLASSGTTLTVWTTGATPAAAYVATFGNAIKSAVLRGNVIYAILADGTLWTVDITTDARPRSIAGRPLDQLARSGTNVVATEFTDAGDTNVRYYEGGNLESPPARTVAVSGAATSRIAMRSDAVALFTFNGISLVNLASGNVTTFPNSNLHLARALTFAGTNRLLELTDRALLVWETPTGRLVRELPLPATPVAVTASGSTAVVASVDGPTIVAYDASQRLPEAIAPRNPNRYFSKVVAGGNRLYLFGTQGIDMYTTSLGSDPRYMTGIAAAGLIDLAASNDHLFTLASNGTVSTYSDTGALIAQTQIDEGSDARPLAIATAAGAVWVAYEKGCLSGGCERKTLVLHPLSHAITATLPGAVVEAVTSGTRTYALFDQPNELRVYNVASSQQPSQLASRALAFEAHSIAHAGNTVYVLADKLYSFDANSLQPGSEFLTAINADASQRIRIDGACAAIIGRSPNPDLYTLPQFNTSTAFELPATARSIASQNGKLFILTDYSLETWTTTATSTPIRRRAVK